MRTTTQQGMGLSFGLALGILVTWGLNRTIGLSEDEVNLLGPVMTAVLSGVGAFVAPYLPERKNKYPKVYPDGEY